VGPRPVVGWSDASEALCQGLEAAAAQYTWEQIGTDGGEKIVFATQTVEVPDEVEKQLRSFLDQDPSLCYRPT